MESERLEFFFLDLSSHYIQRLDVNLLRKNFQKFRVRTKREFWKEIERENNDGGGKNKLLGTEKWLDPFTTSNRMDEGRQKNLEERKGENPESNKEGG